MVFIVLDLRQIRYFITVAELEHVGKAAESLHISQSPLSRQISLLEERLGLKLFDRKAKRISLTGDGKVFLKEAKALITHAMRLESLGKRLGKGEEGGLCIGYIENAMFSNFLPENLRVLRQKKPNIHTALYHMGKKEQIEGLVQRSLDIALIDEPEHDNPFVISALIYEDPMILIIADDNPIIEKGITDIDNIESLKWITIKGQHTKSFVKEFSKVGVVPDIAMEVEDPISILGLVAVGSGAAFIPSSMKRQLPPNVTCVVQNHINLTSSLYVAWHKDILRPIVEEFKAQLIGN